PSASRRPSGGPPPLGRANGPHPRDRTTLSHSARQGQPLLSLRKPRSTIPLAQITDFRPSHPGDVRCPREVRKAPLSDAFHALPAPEKRARNARAVSIMG